MGQCESCTNHEGEEANEETTILSRQIKGYDLKPA